MSNFTGVAFDCYECPYSKSWPQCYVKMKKEHCHPYNCAKVQFRSEDGATMLYARTCLTDHQCRNSNFCNSHVDCKVKCCYIQTFAMVCHKSRPVLTTDAKLLRRRVSLMDCLKSLHSISRSQLYCVHVPGPELDWYAFLSVTKSSLENSSCCLIKTCLKHKLKMISYTQLINKI